MCLSLLLMTLPSFCQTATKTDSTVCVPKRYAVKAIQDLILYDECKKENTSLCDMIRLKDSYIHTQDSIITLQTDKLNVCEGLLSTCTELNKTDSATIQALTSKVVKMRRQRNAVAIIAGGLLIGFILK